MPPNPNTRQRRPEPAIPVLHLVRGDVSLREHLALSIVAATLDHALWRPVTVEEYERARRVLLGLAAGEYRDRP